MNDYQCARRCLFEIVTWSHCKSCDWRFKIWWSWQFLFWFVFFNLWTIEKTNKQNSETSAFHHSMISQNSNTFLQLCKSECESKEILSEILCGKHTRKSSSILVVSFDVHILTHNALISILCQIDSRCEWEIQCSFYTCNCDFFFFC